MNELKTLKLLKVNLMRKILPYISIEHQKKKDLYINIYNSIYKFIHWVKTMQKDKVIHYPNLKTVLMVEDILKKANTLMSREAIKRELPTKIMHQTLNVILKYLEDSGKILDGRKGILWIYNSSSKLDKAIQEGVEL